MNIKDREALDKFVDEDSLSPEDTKRFAEMTDGERATFIAERFFEAGAKHGRAQLNELRDDNMAQLYETIKEMQNAYETLQVHDEMLIATVDKLKEENKKLRDALKYYANPVHWNDSGNLDYDMTTIDYEDAAIPEGYCDNRGGKLARQVLKEVGEE